MELVDFVSLHFSLFCLGEIDVLCWRRLVSSMAPRQKKTRIWTAKQFKVQHLSVPCLIPDLFVEITVAASFTHFGENNICFTIFISKKIDNGSSL